MTTQPTAHHIKHKLATLYNQTIELTALANKQIHINTTINNRPTQTSAPLPINLTASDLLNHATALARLLCKACNLHPTRAMSAKSMVGRLMQDDACEKLATRSDAWNIVRIISEVCERNENVLDPSPACVLVGSCVYCSQSMWVPERVLADTACEYRCDMCGRLVDLQQVRQQQHARLLLSGVVGTASELVKLLRQCGYQITIKRVSLWHTRGRLHSVGTTLGGRKIYPLSSVLTLLGG